jgi:magnesium chelatase accessory protein
MSVDLARPPTARAGEALDWAREGRDWPNRAASRFVEAGGLPWHVQVGGAGPVVLLVHGTGAATHSWRGLVPLLTSRFTVVAPDLPGHGFTAMPPVARGVSLPGMAAGLRALLDVLDLRPDIAVGHSAGAAILARMCLDGAIAPRVLISLNGALMPLPGVPGRIFSPLARLFSNSTFMPRLFALHAGIDANVVPRLIRNTGSRLDAEGERLYRLVARSPRHVGAAFAMMANWDLHPLVRDLPKLTVPLVLAVGTDDRTIRPSDAARVRAMLAQARIVRLSGLGHLAHEERPEAIAALIEAEAHTDATARS